MDKMRCLVCGSSTLDPKGYKCGKCGSALGLRSEQCHISSKAKLKLLVNSGELKKFGVEVQQYRTLEKRMGGAEAMAAIGLGLAIADSLKDGVLRDCVLFLRDNLSVSEQDVLALRLNEPELILTYYRMDKKHDIGAD
jgi:hypothetical protein